MEEVVLNLACDKVAVYDHKGEPKIGIPVGWPNHRTFSDSCSIFELSSEEVQEKYGITFPVYETDPILHSSDKLSGEFSDEINKLYSLNQFPNGRVKTKFDTVDNYVQRGEKFFLLIYLMTSEHYGKPPFRFEDNILNAIRSGLCKVVMTFFSEGHSREREHVEWIQNFGGHNELNPSNFYFVHSNYNFQSTINKMRSWYGYKINFKYIPVPYFEYSAWFLHHNSPYIPGSNALYKLKYTEFLNDNRNKNIRKHFSILNRRPRQHRVILFTEIMSNPLLASTSEISLNGEESIINSNEFVREHLKAISEAYPEYVPNYKFALTHNFLIPKILDVELDTNRAGEYTRDFYKNTFCSLTSETLINPDELFFSEKTFKPIYNMHPFLFLGNPYSLKKLREFGYKTFSNWWDESYDEELDYLLRIKKISKVMQEIATWSHEKCAQITQEMEEVLIHNFYNFLDNTRYEDFVLDLYNNHKPEKVKKTLI